MTGLAADGPEFFWKGYLRVRIIALENLVVALLPGASDDGRGQARRMAPCISPRLGFVHNQLMTRVADRLCVRRPT